MRIDPIEIVVGPVEMNLRFYQGDDTRILFWLENPDSSPMDLVGSIIQVPIKKLLSPQSALGEFTVIPLDLANGHFGIEPPAVNLRGKYALQITDSLGKKKTWFTGSVALRLGGEE